MVDIFNKDMVSTEELAKMLGYTKQNITYLARKGKITYIRRGRKYFFDKEVIKMLVKTEE